MPRLELAWSHPQLPKKHECCAHSPTTCHQRLAKKLADLERLRPGASARLERAVDDLLSSYRNYLHES